MINGSREKLIHKLILKVWLLRISGHIIWNRQSRCCWTNDHGEGQQNENIPISWSHRKGRQSLVGSKLWSISTWIGAQSKFAVREKCLNNNQKWNEFHSALQNSLNIYKIFHCLHPKFWKISDMLPETESSFCVNKPERLA